MELCVQRRAKLCTGLASGVRGEEKVEKQFRGVRGARHFICVEVFTKAEIIRGERNISE